MGKNAIRFLAIALAVLLLFHGVDKIINGISSIVSMLDRLHIPYSKYVAYGVYIGEVLAPLMVIFNQYVRIALLLIASNMLIAIVLAYRTTLFTLNSHGAWSIEVPLLYLLIALTLFVLYQPVKAK